MNTENRKTNQPYKFVLKSERLDLRSSNNDAAIQNLTIYYMWKNIRKQYKKNKLKIIAPMMNLNYQMVLILHQIFKIIMNILLKSMKY